MLVVVVVGGCAGCYWLVDVFVGGACGDCWWLLVMVVVVVGTCC